MPDAPKNLLNKTCGDYHDIIKNQKGVEQPKLEIQT
jgi:hypothetical protein